VKTRPEGPINPKDLVHRFLLQHAEECKKLYDETGNPLYVWEIVQKWFSGFVGPNGEKGPSPIQSGLQLPEWTHEYILTAAVKLVYKSKEESSQSSDVGALLGFTPPDRASGGNSFFKQYHDSVSRHFVLSHLCSLLESEQKSSIEKACEKIADKFPELNVDSLTIKGWYDDSNKSKKIK
jgi:hypothetical protein